MPATPPWSLVWITGASTGIGRELALKLAAEGVKVAASARSVEALGELAKLAPNITPYPVDVTDVTATAEVAARIERENGPIDLAILSAGVWSPMNAGRFDAGACAQSMAVNYLGIVNTIAPLMPLMMKRGRGHLAFVASVAGYRGLPRGAAYGPSKAAVINLAECLYLDLARYGVAVSVVNPGFVDTPMTKKNTFPMPYLMPAEAAASRILAGLRTRRFEIAFPWQMVRLLKASRHLPYAIQFWLLGLITAPGQPSQPHEPGGKRLD